MGAAVLSGIRVLDLTQYIAGPYCTKMFADWGAEVIKIEKPRSGDPARWAGPFPADVPHPEKSGLFLHLNTNKKSVTLNLASDIGRRAVLDLAKESDIVVESFRPGTMDRLGLGYDELKAANARLIVTSISNFGQTGPYRDMVASEAVLFALGGPMNVMGLPDRAPIMLGGNHVQYQAGNSAAYASLAAWYGREYAGSPGQYLDVSIMETQAETINFRKIYLTSYQYRGERATRAPVSALGYPSGFHPCSDGYIVVNGGGQFWPRTCRMLGHPEWVNHEEYGLPAGQFNQQAKEKFDAEVWLPWVISRTKVEVMEECQRNGILCGAVMTVEDATTSSHYRERGFWIDVQHPVAGTITQPGPQFVMEKTPRPHPVPAPLLGEHTNEILVGRLGYTPQQVSGFAAAGIV